MRQEKCFKSAPKTLTILDDMNIFDIAWRYNRKVVHKRSVFWE